MKKRLCLFVVLCGLSLFAFTACTNDDTTDGIDDGTIGTDITGTGTGTGTGTTGTGTTGTGTTGTGEGTGTGVSGAVITTAPNGVTGTTTNDVIK